MTYNTLIYEKRGLVASITLNLPDSGNAITTQLALELADVCTSFNQDETVRVVTISGAGERHFCVGTDPSVLPSTAQEEQQKDLLSVSKTISTITKPVIAMINGDALGQGLELALACDLRIAAETAHFGFPQITSGFIPWDGGTQLLPRIIGRGKAIEMILTGETIGAPQAYEMGLINKVVSSKKLMPTVMELAGKLMGLRGDLPIILCTGFSRQIDEEKAKRMGIGAFVMKPIVMDEIAHRIRYVLDKP